MANLSLVSKEAIEHKSKEIAHKYMELIDNIISFNTLMKELELTQ